MFVFIVMFLDIIEVIIKSSWVKIVFVFGLKLLLRAGFILRGVGF